MQTSQDRLKLKQQRTIKFFIEAAREIIEKEGIEAVTIRKASDIAGYSSATLYNYFDNLPHLVFLATMSYLDEYHAALPAYLAKCENSIEWYMAICKCFSEFAFADPEVYELIFFTHSDEKLEEYTHQYYDLFPEKVVQDWPRPFNQFFNINNMYARNRVMMDYCVEEGFFTTEGTVDFLDVSLRVFKSILQDVRSGELDRETAVSLTMKYYFQLLGCYMLPGHDRELERVMERWS